MPPMKNVKRLTWLLALLLVTACAEPIDRSYHPSHFDKDFKALEASGKLDSTQLATLALFILRFDPQDTLILNKPYALLLKAAQQARKDSAAPIKKGTPAVIPQNVPKGNLTNKHSKDSLSQVGNKKLYFSSYSSNPDAFAAKRLAYPKE